jgi:hypothetical protein
MWKTYHIVWTQMVGIWDLQIMSSAQNVPRLLQGILNLICSEKGSCSRILVLVVGVFVHYTEIVVMYSCHGEGADGAVDRSAQENDLLIRKHTVKVPSEHH